MEPRASFGSFTIRGRRANEPAKHYRIRLMADGKFVAGWLAVKVSEVDHRGLAKRLVAVVLDRPSRDQRYVLAEHRVPGGKDALDEGFDLVPYLRPCFSPRRMRRGAWRAPRGDTKPDPRQVSTAALRLYGHPSMGQSGVAVQCARGCARPSRRRPQSTWPVPRCRYLPRSRLPIPPSVSGRLCPNPRGVPDGANQLVYLGALGDVRGGASARGSAASCQARRAWLRLHLGGEGSASILLIDSSAPITSGISRSRKHTSGPYSETTSTASS